MPSARASAAVNNRRTSPSPRRMCSERGDWAEYRPDHPAWSTIVVRGKRREGRSGGRALQDVDAAGRAEPDHVGQADLGVLDLAIAGLTPQVVADLPDVGDAGGRD